MISIVAPLDYERYGVLTSAERIAVSSHSPDYRPSRNVEPLNPSAAGRDALTSQSNDAPGAPANARGGLAAFSERSRATGDTPREYEAPQPFERGLPISAFTENSTTTTNTFKVASLYEHHPAATGSVIRLSG